LVGGSKLYLVSMDQMTNEHIAIVVQLEQHQWTHGEARKDGPPPNHMRGMLARYKDDLTNRLLKKKLPPSWEQQFCSQKCWFLKLCCNKWSWWMDMMKVKAIWNKKWPLTHKGIRSLFGLANYYHHFIQDFSEMFRISSNLLKNRYSKSGMNFVNKPLKILRTNCLRRPCSLHLRCGLL
jgi:hypothetical protein